MLDKSNVLYLARLANDLLNGPKRNVSRSLRRLLEQALDTPPSGKPLLIQSFAFDEGHNPTQLRGIELFAIDNAVDVRVHLPEGHLVRPLGTIRDDMFSSVQNSYEVLVAPSTASLAQLQALVTFVMELAYSMVAYADNPSVTADLEDYQYRNLGCNIAADDELWCVSGSDKRGGNGVLEWCFDESDARYVLEQMQRYPERFSGLTAASWQQVQSESRPLLAA